MLRGYLEKPPLQVIKLQIEAHLQSRRLLCVKKYIYMCVSTG